MEGREHTGVILALNASGDPVPAPGWDPWYAEDRWPKSTSFDGCTAAALFRLAAGHSVPAFLTHAAVYETGRVPSAATIDGVRAALEDESDDTAMRTSRVHLGHYTKCAEYGDGTGQRAAGILIVLSDPLGPTQEGEFHQWYDEHGPHILEQMDYYAATRYTADDPDPWQPSQLTIYETASDDVDRIYRDGLAWFLSLPPEEQVAPLRLWWERPFERRA